VRPWLVACAVTLAFIAGERSLLANGRFPRAQRLREDNGDPDRLVLAATYGLLITRDRGAEWRHVCEMGYAGTIDDIDPLVEIPPDGAILVTAAHSLNRLTSPFCAFEPVLGGAGTETVVDYAMDPSDRNHVVALFMRSGDGGVVNELYQSFDGGRTFSSFGAPLPEEIVFSVTFDVAASDPNRFYATAAGRTDPELFVRSDDRGASWTTRALELRPEEQAYIAAVHPTDPDIVYVRTDLWELDEFNVLVANDGLFYSDDGGETFSEIHRARGKLFGFALSPDASEVLIAYGDPVDSTAPVDPAALGIYRAKAADHAFSKIFEGPVSCLAWTENGVYACTSQSQHGFALGFAESADFDLGTSDPLTPLLDLPSVAGPLECDPSSPGAVCGEDWPMNCAALGACDGGVAGSASGGSAGNGASGPAGSGNSGAAGSATSGAASGGTSGAGATKETEKSESSCGCRAAGRRTHEGLLAALFVSTAAFARRRRLGEPR
jgi:hypothetical protein